MKVVLVFLLFVALVASDEDEPKFLEECTEETGLNHSDVKEFLLADDAETDAKATKYMVCFFKKVHAIDDDGKLNIEKAQETVKKYMKEIDAEDDQGALDCIQEKASAEETALAIAKCVSKRKEELSSKK